MRILIVVDKPGTAIDRLARSIQRNLPQHQIVIFPVHPKRNDIETTLEAQKLLAWADLVDIHYWKSGQVLRTAFPSEFDAKPKILFHFNPYDAETEENKYYNKVVVGNKAIHNKIPFAYLIPYGIDLGFFTYNQHYTEEKRVMMSVNRIEGKKGVLEVALACKDLGYTFTLVGRVSKPEYMKSVLQANANIEFWEDASEEKLKEVYYQSAIHVCNSIDDFESGTLPILEAMACGTPVVTRMIGHVPELYDGSNMIVRSGATEDIEDLKKVLKECMETPDWRQKIREKAWSTIKARDDRRMALDINKLYYKTYRPNVPLVSIIIPTKDHPESFAECLLAAVQQNFPKFEIIVCDSGVIPVRQIITEVKKQTEIPIRYIRFSANTPYTLAEARNRGVIESDGSILVFCDDRIRMKPNAVSVFATYIRPKAWIWGKKDDYAKSFVENFSCVQRSELIRFGMFNERMQWYGGMTQEIRERFENRNGFDFIFMDEAQAEGIKKSSSKNKRREDIIDAKYLIYKMYNK